MIFQGATDQDTDGDARAVNRTGDSGDWIRLREYVPKLVGNLLRSFDVDTQFIILKTQIEDRTMLVDSAFPCGLIINELVSNALKYAFPEGHKGEIAIDLRADDANDPTCILTVTDNGISLPADLEVTNSETLGL